MDKDILLELRETKKMLDETRLKQEFWRGVVRGVIGSAVAFSGLMGLVYYMVQIVVALK